MAGVAPGSARHRRSSGRTSPRHHGESWQRSSCCQDLRDVIPALTSCQLFGGTALSVLRLWVCAVSEHRADEIHAAGTLRRVHQWRPAVLVTRVGVRARVHERDGSLREPERSHILPGIRRRWRCFCLTSNAARLRCRRPSTTVRRPSGASTSIQLSITEPDVTTWVSDGTVTSIEAEPVPDNVVVPAKAGALVRAGVAANALVLASVLRTKAARTRRIATFMLVDGRANGHSSFA